MTLTPGAPFALSLHPLALWLYLRVVERDLVAHVQLFLQALAHVLTILGAEAVYNASVSGTRLDVLCDVLHQLLAAFLLLHCVLRLLRLKLIVNRKGCIICRLRTLSVMTARLAVAVRAMTGIPGKLSLSLRNASSRGGSRGPTDSYNAPRPQQSESMPLLARDSSPS